MESKLVHIEEVATILNEKVNTVRDWVARKRIPCYKPGKRLQFSLEEIAEWKEQFHRPARDWENKN